MAPATRKYDFCGGGHVSAFFGPPKSINCVVYPKWCAIGHFIYSQCIVLCATQTEHSPICVIGGPY